MSKKQKDNQSVKPVFLFNRTNYYLMIAGAVLIAIGFTLMAGGGSDNPEVFNESIYNWRRIRLAPTIVILGFVVEIWAILYKNKTSK
jgi:NADH:ubiquinone oxidoreductase subunit 6 (subunit J)